MLNSFSDLNFEVIKKTDNSRFSNGNDIRLVNLGPIAFFSNFKLTTFSGKHLEDISHGHIVSLMYKLKTSSKNSDDLSIGFHRSRNTRKNELTLSKNTKGKHHLKILLKDVFGFAECHEKATEGFGYKLTLTRNKDDEVIDTAVGIANARKRIDHMHWYVPHYTPCIQQHSILSNQIIRKIPTELRYIERSVFIKEVNNQNLWSFELGSQESTNVPIWVIIGFQERDTQDIQNLNNDTFDLMGDDTVDLSTENDALKSKIGSYDEKWLEESETKQLKQTDDEKRANLFMLRMKKQMEEH